MMVIYIKENTLSQNGKDGALVRSELINIRRVCLKSVVPYTTIIPERFSKQFLLGVLREVSPGGSALGILSCARDNLLWGDNQLCVSSIHMMNLYMYLTICPGTETHM